MQTFRIVDAGRIHRRFIKRLSGDVFAQFGDYETWLPGLVGLPWIHASIAVFGDEPVGFAMISLEDVGIGEVDLVAIAVERQRQSGGVGRRLLSHVEEQACSLVTVRPAVVRLTVAESNARALDMFRRSGYDTDGREPGAYPRGQTSIEMRKIVAV